jgi:PEGA domain
VAYGHWRIPNLLIKRNFAVASQLPFTLDGRLKMKKGLLILTVALMTLAPMGASAAIRGAVVFGRPYYSFGWYSPFWGSYWGPYWGAYGPYYAYPNSGEIKVDTKVKDAQVFIDGAYAGTTHENKTMHLRPGSYNIEIREGDQPHFTQRVYVVAGKTIHLHPEL